MTRLGLLLLVPLLLFAGCEGLTIDLGKQQTPHDQPIISHEAKTEVLAFTAKWCSACQRDKSQIEKLRRQGVNITEVDSDEHPEMVKRYRIKSLPTYVVLKDGVEVQRTGSILLLIKVLVVVLKIGIPLMHILA